MNLATNKVAMTIPISSGAAVFGDALSPDGKTLYVNGLSLTAVDLTTGTVIGTVPTSNQNPYRLGISRDGQTLFAANLTNSTVDVVNAATLTLTGVIATLAPPYGFAFDMVGNAYVLNENGSHAVTIDTTSMQPLGSVPVGAKPAGALTTPSGTTFILNANSGNLSTVNNPTPIPLTGLILLGSFTYLNGNVYVNAGALVKSVDATTLAVNGTLAIPFTDNFTTANQITASPATGLLYGTYVQGALEQPVVGGGVVQYNPQTNAVGYISSGQFVGRPLVVSADGGTTYTVGGTLGHRPSNTVQSYSFGPALVSQTYPSANFVALHLSADGKTLYVLDSNGMLDYLNATTLLMTASVPVGVKPSNFALSFDGTQAVVTDSGSHTVSVIDLLNRAVIGSIGVGGTSSAASYLN